MATKKKKSRVKRAVSYPKRRFQRFRRGRAPMPVLPIIGGLVAPMADCFTRVGGVEAFKTDPVRAGMGMLDQISQHYVGYSPFPELSNVHGLNTAYLANTYGGLIMGYIGHKVANKFGVNRTIRKIPYIGKYVEL